MTCALTGCVLRVSRLLTFAVSTFVVLKSKAGFEVHALTKAATRNVSQPCSAFQGGGNTMRVLGQAEQRRGRKACKGRPRWIFHGPTAVNARRCKTSGGVW